MNVKSPQKSWAVFAFDISFHSPPFNSWEKCSVYIFVYICFVQQNSNLVKSLRSYCDMSFYLNAGPVLCMEMWQGMLLNGVNFNFWWLPFPWPHQTSWPTSLFIVCLYGMWHFLASLYLKIFKFTFNPFLISTFPFSNWVIDQEFCPIHVS